ncbi:MFS polyamine transporter [Mycena leptocephala]|nr:MFS polyamine transporter [Mycena leptocephala]
MVTTTPPLNSGESSYVFNEGLAIKSLQHIDEPLDPRLGLSSGPYVDGIDSTLGRTLAEKSQPLDEVIYVDFKQGDVRNPTYFPRSKKWGITLLACYSTLIASSTCSAYNLGFASMRDLNCSDFEATVGFIVFTLGFGIVPLVSSSFSEEFGRQPLYIGSAIGFTSISKNIQTVIIARFLQGSFGSTWATMVNLWTPREWIEMNPKLEWRWIQWIQMIICGCYSLLVPLVMRETRSSILLTRLAKKIRKETGDHRYRARIEDERASLSTLIFVSCTRPIHLLFTEPVVSSFSLWIGFLWGVLFCGIESIPGVFRDLHHFNIGQEGTVFVSIIAGTALGFASNFYQEHLYHKHLNRRGPEARLILACAAAIMLPISMFIYAWCSFPDVPWISLVIALTLSRRLVRLEYFRWICLFILIHPLSYGPFASSALAGQSLCRNIMATIFPLFTKQMFATLGYNWANTMFALIAAVMVPIPFVLFFYGPAIRSRSRFSRIVMEQQEK